MDNQYLNHLIIMTQHDFKKALALGSHFVVLPVQFLQGNL